MLKEEVYKYGENMKIKTLYSCDYFTGEFSDVNRKEIGKIVLQNYLSGNNMDPDPSSIRNEDIRIPFDDNIRDLASKLANIWAAAAPTGKKLELAYKNDPNEAFWAVVHAKGESTNLHSHENQQNYQSGPHVSAAFWVQVPENSGNFVFRYKPNPYIVANEVILSKPGHFLLFDSAMEHFVTKNCSDGHRIVISMNFNIVES